MHILLSYTSPYEAMVPDKIKNKKGGEFSFVYVQNFWVQIYAKERYILKKHDSLCFPKGGTVGVGD